MSGIRTLFVSPHLDDVAFSCGGTVAKIVHAGGTATLCTIFTRSIQPMNDFAVRCQTDKGIPAEVDYLELRKQEDRAFSSMIGMDRLIWLDYPEAQYRGYCSSQELFTHVKDTDNVLPGCIAEDLIKLGNLPVNRLYFCYGIGHHVDHLLTRRTAEIVRHYLPASCEIYLYEDLPYGLRSSENAESLPGLDGQTYEEITSFIETKVNGAALYASQIPFQFGGTMVLNDKLRRYAERVALRAGVRGYSEAFWRLDKS